MDDRLYTLKEISGILGISYNHLVNNIVKDGKLETLNIGRGNKAEHRVSQKALDDFIAKQNPQANTIGAAVQSLENLRGSVVISYITTQANPIMPDDALLFADIIEQVKASRGLVGKIPKLDLLINSFGGSLDAAYKIARLLWNYADEVNSIVPIYAKSAATAICLGTNEIIMTPVAELGPVDPIISDPLTKEQFPARSLNLFLRYASDKDKMELDQIDPEIIAKLGDKITPQIAGNYMNMMYTSKEYLEKLLDSYMFKGTKNKEFIKKIVEHLTESHYSHAFVIDLFEAQDIGLKARIANHEEELAVKKIMGAYAQFMNSQNITKLVGNDMQMLNQKTADPNRS